MGNGKIFISYRREDTSGESGRLKDKLEQVFGRENIFYDVETLEAGLNFDESIAKALNESKVLLAMIGPHWLKVEDSNGVKRIQKPQDWVRKEIAEALKRELRVIPVLVNGAEMPDPEDLPEDLKELSLKHAQELSSSRWSYDVGELTKVLEKLVTKIPEPEPDPRPEPKPFVPRRPQPKSWWSKNYLWVLGGFVGFLLLIGMCTSELDYPIEELTSINLIYTGDNFGCILDLEISIDGKKYPFTGGTKIISGLNIGPLDYVITGKINCQANSCSTYGTGILNVYSKASYYIVWNGSSPNQCEIYLQGT